VRRLGPLVDQGITCPRRQVDEAWGDPRASRDGKVGICIDRIVEYAQIIHRSGLIIRRYQTRQMQMQLQLVMRLSQDRRTNGRTHTRIVIALDDGDVILATKHEDRVRRSVSFLRPLDPIRAKLDRKLAPRRAERGAVHAATELVARLDYDKVRDAFVRQLACGNNARHPAAEDEHLFAGRARTRGRRRCWGRRRGRRRRGYGERAECQDTKLGGEYHIVFFVSYAADQVATTKHQEARGG